MKYLVSIIFVCFGLLVFAQSDGIMMPLDSLSHGVVLPDSLESESIVFNMDELPIVNRIAAYIPAANQQDQYFYFAIALSLIFSVVFISSKDIFVSSWRSFFRLQYQIQYGRSDKSSNLIYLLVYAILFILSLSVLLYYSLQSFLQLNLRLSIIVLVTLAYFLWDYYVANLYYLFAGNRKTVDMVKYISLSYAPLWSMLAWFGVFFILLTSLALSKWFAIFLFSLLGFSLIIKELRVLQVLWAEKVEVFSIHFFAYLCTFKFLPFVLLVWLVF